jgi:hypothetical protein
MMTEAEKERLYMLAEEAGEIVQIVGKILRHGYESYHPSDPLRTTNQILLQNELNDLICIVNRMNLVNDIDINLSDTTLHEEKWSKKLKYTKYQEGSNL